MISIKKRGWLIDLVESTATHHDGWVFKFSPDNEQPGAYIGEGVAHPASLTQEQLRGAARLAREAGEAFLAAKNAQE